MEWILHQNQFFDARENANVWGLKIVTMKLVKLSELFQIGTNLVIEQLQ